MLSVHENVTNAVTNCHSIGQNPYIVICMSLGVSAAAFNEVVDLVLVGEEQLGDPDHHVHGCFQGQSPIWGRGGEGFLKFRH